jgi:hypothetical protein
LRILAEEIAVREGLSAALPVHETAVLRAPRDPEMRRQLFLGYDGLGRKEQAWLHLDAWLRLDPAGAQPFLARFVGNGDTSVLAMLATRLAAPPPWQSMAWEVLSEPGQERALRVVLEALVALRPLQPHEVALYVPLLEREGEAMRARKAWLSSLGPGLSGEARLVYDGGFERGDGPAPYGWQWRGSPSGYFSGTDATAPWEGRRAMAWRFPGREIEFAPLQQALVLAPGTYRLSLQVRANLDADGGPFEWTVVCRPPIGAASDLPHTRLLATIPVPRQTPGWRRLATDFVVPPDCPRQRLQLEHRARDRAERLVSGDLAVDAISVESADAQACMAHAQGRPDSAGACAGTGR